MSRAATAVRSAFWSIFKGRSSAWGRLPKARSSSRTAKVSCSIRTRRRATTPASSFRIRKFSQRCGRVALSFVQRAEDVIEAKKLIRGRAAVMSKIEKPQAIDRLPEILEASDALMVARGDLGVELPLERVPSLQKQMTRLARRAGKPVVVATQMLESMIQSPVPTRAEVSDVATAVYEGADAIMLSAESAAGKFPVEAVSTMNRIGEEVERDP